jgi:hypothetical protein
VFLAVAYSLASEIYPAIDELETAAKLDNDSFAAHFTLAKLCFKLRIPQKGNEAATEALRCVRTLEQRKMLTQLLMEERARTRNGISRPWFNKPFSVPVLVVAGAAMLTAIIFATATCFCRCHHRWEPACLFRPCSGSSGPCRVCCHSGNFSVADVVSHEGQAALKL